MNRRQWIVRARIVVPAVLLLAGIAAVANRAKATGTITKADLSGPWQVAMVSTGSGCGSGTTLVTFTLNAAGVATNATETAHSSGCGDTQSTGNTFTISSLNSNGSGTAGLSCGVGCGFAFSIQVSADRSTFSVADVTDPGNFIQGVAIHQ